jgi:hypothetical protein
MEGDWIDMASVPLLTTEEASAEAALGAPGGRGAEDVENQTDEAEHAAETERAAPSADASPVTNPTCNNPGF